MNVAIVYTTKYVYNILKKIIHARRHIFIRILIIERISYYCVILLCCMWNIQSHSLTGLLFYYINIKRVALIHFFLLFILILLNFLSFFKTNKQEYIIKYGSVMIYLIFHLEIPSSQLTLISDNMYFMVLMSEMTFFWFGIGMGLGR